MKNGINSGHQMESNVCQNSTWLIMFLECFYQANLYQSLLLILLHLCRYQSLLLFGRVLEKLVYFAWHGHEKLWCFICKLYLKSILQKAILDSLVPLIDSFKMLLEGFHDLLLIWNKLKLKCFFFLFFKSLNFFKTVSIYELL